MKNTILNNGDVVIVTSPDESDVSFEIIDLVNSGGSSICYIAKRSSTGEKGYFKEFAPKRFINSDVLERNNETNVLFAGDDTSRFKIEKEKYLESYKTISDLRNSKEALLNNFIPHTEFFDSSDGSVYIWTPEPVDAIRFKDYINYICQNPIDMCEMKLLNTLRILITISKCADYLHELGFICLDIKPDNLSIERNINSSDMYDVNASKISYYDLDSIQRFGERGKELSGTVGYCAPEVACGFADSKADIYSIGAILYNAIVVQVDENGNYYNDVFTDRKKYSKIQQCLSDSVLIKNSIINSDEEIMDKLVSILQNSLQYNPNKRYKEFGSMINDLEQAAALLMPGAIINKYGFEEDITNSSINSSLRRINVDANIKLHFWNRPLYCSLKQNNQDNKTMSFLIIGANDISFRFIDILLQCQMYHVGFAITVLTENSVRASELFCKFRPAAKRFININESNDSIETSLDFVEFASVKNISNSSFIRDIRDSLVDKSPEQYDYALVSLGDEKLNGNISGLLYDNSMISGDISYISYVSKADDEDRNIYPIIINEEISSLMDAPDFVDMERMAFNVHTIWKGIDNVTTEDYLEFRKDTYNYNASLMFALSVKYKLFSIGITYSKDNQLEELKETLQNIDRQTMYKLADVEHNRWVYYYVSEGWDIPYDMDDNIDYKRCVNNSLHVDGNTVKYAAKIDSCKQHACLVPGGDSDLLETYTDEEWLVPSAKDDQLDMLDRVSVELYRAAMQAVRHSDLPDNYEVSRINYKLYDVILVEQISSIVFDKHIIGAYDYIPKSINSIRNEEKDDLVDRLDWLSGEIKEYINSILYDKGWRYGDEFSYDKKRIPDMVPFDRMSTVEQSEFKEFVQNIMEIIEKSKE